MPKCPKCRRELKAVYFLNSEFDFYICEKCNIAYNPKTIKPIAHTI